MSQMENSLSNKLSNESCVVSLVSDITPKTDENGVAFSLRSRDFKDPQCIAYKKKGHPQRADQGQSWEETEVNDTLNAFDIGDTRTPTVVLTIENRPQDSRVKIKEDGICQTLDARMGEGGGNVPMVLEMNSYQETTRALCASGYNKLGTQEARNDMFVVQSSWDGTQVAPTLTQNNAGGSQRMPDKDNFNAVITTSHGGFMTNADSSGVGHTLQATDHKDPQLVCAEPKSIVRRLTPVECERLQGYPDGWTDIGDWTGTDGKYHKESSDSSRYKALGNSICLPFWSWMAGRMVEVLKEEGIEKPTMASLFDGIGGFPLVFSQHGVTPVWASEIEEFPIAVTKRRFPDAEEGQLQAEQDADKL